jgi:hypothetical protein
VRVIRDDIRHRIEVLLEELLGTEA